MEVLSQLNDLVWGVPLLALLLGTGIYLSIGLKAMPILKVGFGFRQLWQGRAGLGNGEIPPFRALMTSLSATVGTGNIAGVATAIGLGGPGALFWMWMTALVGMATKYGEAVLAVHYREKDDRDAFVGGPMYYIRNGMGKKWSWLAVLFAVFCGLGGLGIGNTVQANSVADAMMQSFAVPELVTGIVLAVVTALVVLGGIKRIASVAARLVPAMAVGYFLAAMVVILANFTEIPQAIMTIVKEAFSPTAAQGGFAGAAVWLAIQKGVERGLFSNEAGLGSAPIAHAAAQTDSAVRQGSVAMLGTFIDTIIICTLTGLAIVLTGVWTGEAEGAAMTAEAFSEVFSLGDELVALAMTIFAFTTIIGWSYYSERCMEFLFGTRILIPFRYIWVLVIPFGAVFDLQSIWNLSGIMNGLMAIPNLIALLVLSPVIFRLTREFGALK